MGNDSQRKRFLFAEGTCRHDLAIREMNTHVGVNDGVVSSDRDSEIQGSRPQGAELEQHVCGTLSWSERHVIKRNKSQLSGRKLADSSAPERRVSAYLAISTGRERRKMISVA